MLTGLARKFSVPFLLLALLAWVAFGVGFGLRNYYYSDQDSIALNHAAKPDFFFLWLFGVACPVLMVFSFIHAFWEQRFSRLLMFVFLPLYLVAAGGVMFFDGFQIYHFYQNQNGRQVYVFCDLIGGGAADITSNSTTTSSSLLGPSESGLMSNTLLDPPDINGDQLYIPLEFAGAVAAVIFHWIFLLFTPFFAEKNPSYFDAYNDY